MCWQKYRRSSIFVIWGHTTRVIFTVKICIFERLNEKNHFSKTKIYFHKKSRQLLGHAGRKKRSLPLFVWCMLTLALKSSCLMTFSKNLDFVRRGLWGGYCIVLKPDVWVIAKFLYWSSHNAMRAWLRVSWRQKKHVECMFGLVVIL